MLTSRTIALGVALAACVLLGPALAGAQTTWHVDDDAPGDPAPGDPSLSDPLEDGSGAHPFDSIQEAIDVTQPGDTVLVADGTYTGDGNRNIRFGGRGIIVQSENGADRTIVDCSGNGTGFGFSGAGDDDSVLDGFTITGGFPPFGSGGGAIGCSSSTPTIAHCLIRDNRTESNGGGIRCEYASPTIVSCTFARNSADGYGGAVYSYSARPVIVGCSFRDNIAGEEGGAVHAFSGSGLAMINCTVRDNTSYRWGGGLSATGGIVLTNCTVVNNAALDEGGGLYCPVPATLTNCIVWRNKDRNGMGQVSQIAGSEPIVNYSCVAGWTGVWGGNGNTGDDPGFAFVDDYHLLPGSPCVDAGTNGPAGGLPPVDADGNDRALDGDGDMLALADMGTYEYNPDAPSIAVSPSSIEFFAPENGPDPDEQDLLLRNCGGGTLVWTLSETCPWLTPASGSESSTGEVVAIPLAVDGASMSHGDYSCVLTTSDPQAVNTPRTVTITLHINQTLPVPVQYATIQAAIDAAVDGDVVLVGSGTYVGPGNKNLTFAGKGLTLRSQDGPEATIIDCEASGRGLIFDSHEDSSAVVDGFTITNGNAAEHGGAISCLRSSPTIANCTFSDNSTDKYGGALYSLFASPTVANCTLVGNQATRYSKCGGAASVNGGAPVFTDCTFSGNSADFSGGALHSYNSDSTIKRCSFNSNFVFESDGGGLFFYSGKVTISDCTIRGNATTGDGGGMFFDKSVVTISHCTFSGNTAGLSGGGLYGDDGDPTVSNCRFSDNVAGRRGGGMYQNAALATVTNCTLAGNRADTFGGGFSRSAYGNANIKNCIVWGNSARYPTGQGAQIYTDGGTMTVRSSCIQDWEGVWDGGGNLAGDPVFADADGPDDDPATWEDNDYHLRGASPCVDAGSNGALPPDVTDVDGDGDTGEPVPFDLDGNPRFVDGNGDGTVIVDMGAYEYQAEIPDQLHVSGPIPNQVPIGGSGAIDATVQANFVGWPGWEVVFTKLAGSFTLTAGTVSPDGAQAVVVSNLEGAAQMTFVADAVGSSLIGVMVTGSELPMAYSVFEIVEAPPLVGDSDADGDVDLADFAMFQACFNAERGSPPAPGCESCDINEDGFVQLDDFAQLQPAFTGPR